MEVASGHFRDFLVGIALAVEHDERLFLLAEVVDCIEDVGGLVIGRFVRFGLRAFHCDGPCCFPFVVDSFINGTPDEPVFRVADGFLVAHREIIGGEHVLHDILCAFGVLQHLGRNPEQFRVVASICLFKFRVHFWSFNIYKTFERAIL